MGVPYCTSRKVNIIGHGREGATSENLARTSWRCPLTLNFRNASVFSSRTSISSLADRPAPGRRIRASRATPQWHMEMKAHHIFIMLKGHRRGKWRYRCDATTENRVCSIGVGNPPHLPLRSSSPLQANPPALSRDFPRENP